ncbi:hypothetical protein [Mesorhizobium sp.]|uniref:hypothetical protein n=1 Tax=Mesorhizobium sp. TaxID=1871066 RepID=UPI000FE9E3CC|nr:hypothetical protein [Mesorhizobium sp.]RWM29422.1 MAG: hypothetical protein EOR74_07015 [Mesorhizobium sp.]
MKYESKWYVTARAAHARYLAKPMRSSAKAGPESDAKALEYALWLLNRDGVDIEEKAAAARVVYNHGYPRNLIPADLQWSTFVQRDYCAAGLRPRFVQFRFYTPERNGWGRAPAHIYTTFHTVELPNWAFDAGEAEDACELLQ